MKNIGKIGVAAGLAAAAFILLRRRNDGTRLLDDVTHQVSNWANMLMNFKSNLNHANGKPNNQATPHPGMGNTSAKRQVNPQV